MTQNQQAAPKHAKLSLARLGPLGTRHYFSLRCSLTVPFVRLLALLKKKSCRALKPADSGLTAKESRCSGGFTLVEILVATAVAGVIIVLMMDFTANTLRDNSIATARDTLLSDAQIGLDSINQVVRLSGDADANNRIADQNAPGAPGDTYSWQSNSGTLVLATAAIDANHNVLFQDPLHYISDKNNNIYYVSGGTLYRRILANPAAGNVAKTSCPQAKSSSSCPPDSQLMHNVSSFNVSYIDGNGNDASDPSDARAIELSVALSTTKYNQVIKASYTTRTVFRNE